MNERYYQDNESFEISAMSMESIVESMTSMLSTISLAIAAIGGISLLVGGIGVMNIMLYLSRNVPEKSAPEKHWEQPMAPSVFSSSPNLS